MEHQAGYGKEYQKTKSFVKQAAILAAAGIISRILGFVMRIPLTNTIGDEGNGIYSDGYAIYNFFLVLSSAGLPAAISKMVSERLALNKKEEAYYIFKTSMVCSATVGLLGSLVLSLGAGFFANSIHNPRSYYALLALSPTIFIVALMSVFRGYFQGMHSTLPTAVSQLVEQFFNVTFSVALMFVFMRVQLPLSNPYHGDTIALGAAGGQLGTGIGAFAGLIFISVFYFGMRPAILKGVKNKKLKPKYAKKLAVELFKTSIPIIAGTAVFSFSNLVDSTMVKGRMIAAQLSETQAIANYGIYSTKFIAVTTLPVSISAALATAIIPSIAASAVLGDKHALREKINSAMRIAMLISIPAAIGLGVLAGPIIKLVFSNAPEGSALLKYGSISIVFLALSQIATGILQGIGKIHIPVIAAACGVLVKIPLNYILCAIPSINIYGAVISTVACYAVSSGINICMIIKITKLKPDFSIVILKPFIASVAMGMACFIAYSTVYSVLPRNSVSTIISIVTGIFVYGAFIISINGLDKGDLCLMPFGKKFLAFLESRNWV